MCVNDVDIDPKLFLFPLYSKMYVSRLYRFQINHKIILTRHDRTVVVIIDKYASLMCRPELVSSEWKIDQQKK